MPHFASKSATIRVGAADESGGLLQKATKTP